MNRLILPGLCLVCAGFVAACAAQEEPADGRVRLYISARDPGGGKLTFTWRQLPNEAPRVKIADPQAGKFDKDTGKWISDTYFIPTEPGKYLFEVSVKNEAGEESKKVFQRDVLPPAPPPVAAAGQDQEARKAGDMVVINGGGSKAAEGRAIAAWDWRVLKAPGDFKLDAKLLKERSFEFKAVEPGVYQFELKVYDGRKWSEPSRTTVTVAAPTPPPVAAAGKDQACSAGDSLRLDAGESKAAPGLTVTAWEWRVAQAPANFTVDAALLKQRAFEFKPEAPGVYQFELRVSDGERWSEPARTTVTAAPPVPPPVAVAGKDQTKTVGEVVRLNGVDSKAAEGQTLTEWEWRVVQAPPKFRLDAKLLAGRSLDFKAEETGVYQFDLKVGDGKRWSEPSRVTVTITPGQPPKLDTPEPPGKTELPPPPPVVEPRKREVKAAVAPGGTIKVGEIIVLDGSKSVVDEALTPEFFWKQNKGPLAKQLTPDKAKPFSQARATDPLNYPVWTCKAEQPGEYVFVLEIATRVPGATPEAPAKTEKTESEAVVYKAEGTGQEAPPPPPPAAGLPVAKITASRTEASGGEMVRLDGSQSTGTPGEKLEFIWGPVPGKRYPKTWAGTDGPQVEFKAEEEGEYAVALMVKDSAGKFSEQAQVVIKVGPANQPPVVKLARSFECVVGEQVRVEAEANDPEGDRLEYQWVCLDPPDLVVPEKLAKNSILVFVPKNTGAYVFKVTVSDAKGHGVVAQTMVGVKDALARPPTAIIDGPKKPVGIGAKVKLAGGRSADPVKKPLTYLWKQESGPNDVKVPGNVPGEREKEWDFTPTEPGRYVFSLVVSNGVHKSDPDRFELTVTKDNNPPAANIVGPPGGRLAVGEQAVLDGTTSSDPEGDKLACKWRKVEAAGKAGDVELTNADQDRAGVKGLAPGPVRIELVVNDGASDSDPARLDLVVVRPNNRPAAKITGPEAAKVGAAVELSAEQSNDPDGDEISYIWSPAAEGGPDLGVRGRDLRKKTLRFKPERPGTYAVTLEVVDSEGLKSEPVTHKVEVKGPNKPPIAVATVVGSASLAAGSEVKLSARGSRDPEEAPLKFRWKQTGGEALPPFAGDTPVDGEIVNLVPKAAGKYTFELVVNDGDYDSPPAAVSITVKAPNQPPVAVIADVIPCELGERITLDGSASRDADGDKLEHRWRQVSGPEAKFAWRGTGKAKTEAELRKEGEYVFELKVFDGKEWSEPQQVTVTTRAANVPPVAAFAVPELRTEENRETILDASASSDPDKGPAPLTCNWKRISGPSVELVAEGLTARFTPKKAGVYVFQARAFDGKAESAPAEIKVEVLKTGTLPVAVAIAVPNPIRAAVKGDRNDPNVLILDGSKSHGGGGGNRAALTFQWKQVTGEDLRLKAADLTKERVGLRVFRPGAYRFVLVVSDGENRSAPAYVDVEVIEGARLPGSGDPPKSESAPPKTEAPPLPPPPPDAGREPKKTGDAAGQQPTAALPPLRPELQALAGLAKKTDPESEKVLIAKLSDADAETRSAAAVALSQRGRNCVPALIGVLDKGSAQARKEAHWALREITHESLPLDAKKWNEWWESAGKTGSQSKDASAASSGN